MAALTGETLPVTIEEKRNLLLRHHIALWDVIHSCDIIASSDSSIKNVLPNDLHPILNTAKIEGIYVNGGTAGRQIHRTESGPQLHRAPFHQPGQCRLFAGKANCPVARGASFSIINCHTFQYHMNRKVRPIDE